MKLLHIGKKGNLERFSEKEHQLPEFELVDLPVGLPEEEYLMAAGDADIIIADAMAKVSGELLCRMPKLKMLHSEGVGFQYFDLEATRKLQIYVCNCKGMNALAVAEQTLLLMLGMLRDVKNSDEAVRKGKQLEKKEGYMKAGNLLELSDCKVGLIGFGDIGKAVAEILKAFHAEVFYTSRSGRDLNAEKRYQVKYLELSDLLDTCNMVSIHLPLNEDTFELVNGKFIDSMREGSFLVNTSRGELIKGEALIAGLKSGKLAMAALDTIAGEPVQVDNELLCQEEIQEKLLFSPHIGGITASSFRRGYEMIWENIRRIAAGEMPERIVG
jgi:phosphoglycerate dehydrogenase-like enzyme